MEPRIGFVRGMARKCLRKHGISTPPVPVEKIIRAESFQLELIDYPDDTCGESWWEDSVGHIAVNRRHPMTRKRFTMAHELGHLILRHETYRLEDHRGLQSLPQRFKSDPDEFDEESTLESRDPIEAEANQFAAELLMPLTLFKKEWKSGVDVPTLALRYHVSELAAWWQVRSFPMK